MGRGKGILPTPDFGGRRLRCVSGPYEGHWFLPEDLVANMSGRLNWWERVENWAVFNFLMLDEVAEMDPSEYQDTALYGKFEDGLGYVVLRGWVE